PAHQADVAVVHAGHARALDHAGVPRLAGARGDRRAARAVPGGPAVVRPRHALVAGATVLREQVALEHARGPTVGLEDEGHVVAAGVAAARAVAIVGHVVIGV